MRHGSSRNLRPRLDHRVELEPCQSLTNRGNLFRQIGIEGVESVAIESDGHTLVAELGENVENILEPVMGEAVGDIPQEQWISAKRFSNPQRKSLILWFGDYAWRDSNPQPMAP